MDHSADHGHIPYSFSLVVSHFSRNLSFHTAIVENLTVPTQDLMPILAVVEVSFTYLLYFLVDPCGLCFAVIAYASSIGGPIYQTESASACPLLSMTLARTGTAVPFISNSCILSIIALGRIISARKEILHSRP
ncbi:hypothetical protein K503DRAFT_770146 [Rhizopogon vinicolor AM-OR11-026]|uniref:Uncharacterized protein n=1 Tax=Rhizopogon vinicolor AM-OR11-026 TaxID=1314800 RepID=A0A1B7N1L4_9AGAM|nr:hypothetical protein K503DRAFT_770146 [Rhizopogon vinicolor AM-OR11-026]